MFKVGYIILIGIVALFVFSPNDAENTKNFLIQELRYNQKTGEKEYIPWIEKAITSQKTTKLSDTDQNDLLRKLLLLKKATKLSDTKQITFTYRGKNRQTNLEKLNNSVEAHVERLVPSIEQLVEESPYKKQIKCLAKNLFFEARGEMPAGKLAAAYVPVTRYSEDGRSICDHIYFKKKNVCAFSWVCEVTSLADARRRMYKDDKNYKISLVVSYIAFNAILPDPTEGANHYYNPDVANPKWAKTMKPVSNSFISNGILGNHRFMKAE